jgi:tyrosine-protein kinase Etk/Wzc
MDSAASGTAFAGRPGRSLLDVVVVLARRWRLLAFLPLGIGLVTLAIAFAIPPTFTASTQLLPPQQPSSAAVAMLGSLSSVAGALGGGVAGLKNPTDQWIGLMRSRAVADALVERFGLKTLYEADYQFQARDGLAARTRIAAGRDGLITIEVDDKSAERAAKIATAYVEELQHLMTTLAVTEAAQRRLFFQRQLQSTKEELVKAEIALKGGGISADVVKTSPTAAVGQLAQAQAALAAQEVKVAVMRGSMTENNPEYRQAALELESMREQMKRAERDQPAGRGSEASAKYIARYREFKYYETLYDLFARQYEMARADESREGAVVQVVDPAQVPEYKSQPKRAKMAILATVLSFMVTLVYVLTRDAWQNMSRQPEGQRRLAELRRALRLRASD